MKIGTIFVIFIIFDALNCAPLETNPSTNDNTDPNKSSNDYDSEEIRNVVNPESRKAASDGTDTNPLAPVREVFSNATNNVQQFVQGLAGNNSTFDGIFNPLIDPENMDLMTPVMILGTYQALKMPIRLPPLTNVITGLGNAGTTLNNAGNFAGGAAGILQG